MKLKQLGLKNYRNCENILLDFFKQKTLIIGKNAQGKTNILESIYMLSDLKSPRTSTMTDMIRFSSNAFEINAQVEKNSTDIELDVSYNSEKKRELKLNKVKTTPKNFKSVVKTVLFSTKDLLLLRGAPQDRRDWLDRAISQIYPAYDERLSKYEKIRIHRLNINLSVILSFLALLIPVLQMRLKKYHHTLKQNFLPAEQKNLRADNLVSDLTGMISNLRLTELMQSNLLHKVSRELLYYL